jgi:hypothetical protein
MAARLHDIPWASASWGSECSEGATRDLLKPPTSEHRSWRGAFDALRIGA